MKKRGEGGIEKRKEEKTFNLKTSIRWERGKPLGKGNKMGKVAPVNCLNKGKNFPEGPQTPPQTKEKKRETLIFDEPPL